MDTSTRATVVAALAAGYVIGRTKQGKLALSLLAFASGKSLDPRTLIEGGTKWLSENPQLAQLGEQVRGELLASGRGALNEVTNRGVASLGEVVQQRLLSLTGVPDGEVEDEDAEDAEDAEDQEEEEPKPSRPSRRRSLKRTRAERPTDRKPGPKNPPAKRAMARKAAERKPGPKNPPAKKAMARKAAEAESAGKKDRGEARAARRKGRG